MDIDLLRDFLSDDITIEYHEELPSTNDRALELAREGAPHGTLVLTEYQRNGRGRRGTTWSAPAGSSILASLIIRPAQPLKPHQLAIYSGAAVALALEISGIPARIKWPNDIMLNDLKIGGILVETTGDAVVIGFGINYHIAEEDFPENLHYPAGSLHNLVDCKETRESLLANIVLTLMEMLPGAYDDKMLKILLAWNKLNWIKRKRVRVTGPMGCVEGDGIFLSGNDMKFHVLRGGGVVPMPLSSKVEVL
ncbi:MAG: biotin--[acetyl-CoA-carboxylase] ligase [bacterium]